MAGSHSSPDWQSKILKKEYQNWLSVGHALSLMLDGLRPYIEKEMMIFHHRLLTNLSSAPPCVCPNSTNHKRTCAWSKYLIGCHRARKPKWHQSDPKKWSDINCGYWEIAKLFMADLGASKAAVVDANTTDCTGLINLISWCDHFQVNIHLISAVRETRNTKWGHAPRQELTDAQKSSALNSVRNLLQDPELVADANTQKALHEITSMEKEFDVKSVERKVLADFQLAVYDQLGHFEEEMQSFKGKCTNISQKMQRRSLYLEKQVKKLERLFEDIKGRMVEMETRNTPCTSWSFIGRSLDKSMQIIAGNLKRLHTKSLLIFLIILLTCFTSLEHNSYYDGCPLETEDVPFDTKEFNFTSQLNAARDGFTGRQWLYHNLDLLLLHSEGDTVPGVVVVGEPGAGKSALSAQLICSRSSNPYIHKRIIGYHLCKHSDKATQDPGRFVRNLVDLIARRVPQYGMLIYNSSFISRILERSCLGDPFDCFEQAVVVPLHQLKDKIQNYFVVVDALDECSDLGDSGTSMVHFIKENYARLPRWIHLILTSRNDSSVLRHLSRFPKLHLSSTDSRNLQDIEIFITAKAFENPSLLEMLKFKLGFGDQVPNLTSKLLHQSQGNFLFAKEMLRYLNEDPQGVDLNKLPNTIGEHYESYSRRAFGSREKFKSALAVLEVLVSSFEPLTIDRLFDVLNIREKTDYEYDLVYTLRSLSHFITYGRDNTISLFHLSFQEWLTSEENLGNPYYVSCSRGHIRLSEYYMTLVTKNPNSSENIYRLAQHITFDQNGNQFLEQFKAINASFINGTIDNENRTLLHLAAKETNSKVLRLLRSFFHDIDCEDTYGFTPAFVAGMNGLLENADYLFRQGSNMEHRSKPPPTPNYLLADPIERSKTAFWNSTIMHAAAAGGHSKVVLLLLERNASFTGLNAVNLTAIELAAEKGHLEVVKILYERGGRLNHLSLQYAAFEGHVDVVEFIQSVGVVDRCMRCDGSFYWLGNKTRYQAAFANGVDYILSDDRFKILCQSALHLAVAKNHTEVVSRLLQQEDSTNHCTDFTGRTPLHEAVRQNHVEIAELLIKHGARISKKCSFFQSISISNVSQNRGSYYLSEKEVLEYDKDLCHCGSTPFLLAARYGHIDVASLLLSHGARPDVMDGFGATPLHVAACHGHYRFIDWLILQRPVYFQINHRSKNHSTLLHSAAICHNNKDIEPLISRGARIDLIDDNGMTPLHYSTLNAVETDGITIFEGFINPTSEIFVWSSKGDITVSRDSGIFQRKIPLHVQCLKLIGITKSTHAYLINKVDKKGRTALHLAAQNGDECHTSHLLRKGARTDLTDHEGRTPLDVAIDSTQDNFYAFDFMESSQDDDDNFDFRQANFYAFDFMESSQDDDDNFDFRQAIHMRSHTAVADILLHAEAQFSHICDGRQASLLHRAFLNEKPFIADRILSKGALLSCRDREGRTPLLIYLQNGGTWLDVVLNRRNVTISIECRKPFNLSEFHLAAFRKPTTLSDNFLERHFSKDVQSFKEDGPLAKSIKAHPRGFRVIDECRDEEGYTALHRAAQGGNLIALKWFLSRAADPTVLTSQGHSALTLAILSGINPYSFSKKREAAEKTAAVLLQAMTKISRFDVGCNIGDAKLTIYHLAAYAGLTGLVQTLLNSKLVRGIDVNCSNAHGITPLYLAKLNIMRDPPSDGESNPWQKIADFIEKHGGVLTYPNRKAEFQLLYKHLFGSFLNPFRLGTLNSKSEWFYESDVSQCRASDFEYYKAGTMINPYREEIDNELLRITESLVGKITNYRLVLTELHQLQSFLTITREVRSANLELLQINEETSNGLQRIEVEAARRRNQARNPNATTVKIPKVMRTWSNLTKSLISLGNDLASQEQKVSEARFKHDSLNAIDTHYNKHIKKLLYKYKQVFGDATEMFNLLEKYEESNLCNEEIFQAKMINMNFIAYVTRSRIDDYYSFARSCLRKGEFASERIPTEWISIVEPQGKVTWNEAIKFLYRQGTQRHDSTFDYLQVLSLGCDKDTRVPLSVEAFPLD